VKERVVNIEKEKVLLTCFAASEMKNDCAGEAQYQLAGQTEKEPE
jgi:hypothetical protein